MQLIIAAAQFHNICTVLRGTKRGDGVSEGLDVELTRPSLFGEETEAAIQPLASKRRAGSASVTAEERIVVSRLYCCSNLLTIVPFI